MCVATVVGRASLGGGASRCSLDGTFELSSVRPLRHHTRASPRSQPHMRCFSFLGIAFAPVLLGLLCRAVQRATICTLPVSGTSADLQTEPQASIVQQPYDAAVNTNRLPATMVALLHGLHIDHDSVQYSLDVARLLRSVVQHHTQARHNSVQPSYHRSMFDRLGADIEGDGAETALERSWLRQKGTARGRPGGSSGRAVQSRLHIDKPVGLRRPGLSGSRCRCPRGHMSAHVGRDYRCPCRTRNTIRHATWSWCTSASTASQHL